MNEQQRSIFSKIVDLNWEIGIKKAEVTKMEMKLSQLDNDLRESMGLEAYTNFMNHGKKMFAPVEE
jgi:hypothetical protein